jgi:hypothetical protein
MAIDEFRIAPAAGQRGIDGYDARRSGRDPHPPRATARKIRMLRSRPPAARTSPAMAWPPPLAQQPRFDRRDGPAEINTRHGAA